MIEFYLLLGCRYLSEVVREKCHASGEKEDARICSEFRALVPERLRLFLHHNPHPGISVPRFDNNDVTVRVWEHLSVSKALVVGNNETVRERHTWAFAKYEQGTLQLWFSGSARQDMYE